MTYLYYSYPRRKRPPLKLIAPLRLLRLFLLACLLSIFTLLSNVHPRPPLFTFRAADPRAIQVATDAVRDVLTCEWDRLASPLFSDDSDNILLLVDKVRIPPVFVSRLGVEGRRQLLRRLSVDSNGMLLFESLPQIVIVDVQNGLGNRLRALGSALEFAFYTRRILVILWATDAHISASMHDLFHPDLLQNLIIIQHAVPWPIDAYHIHESATSHFKHVSINSSHPSTSSFRYFNFMAKDTAFMQSAPKQIEKIGGKHVYIKTAYVIPSKWTRENLINAFIQKLTAAPSVLSLVQKVEDSIGGRGALKKMIGVHIRSRSIVNDNEQVDHECEYSINGAAVTDRWRKMSTPEQFIPEMHRIRSNWRNVVSASYGLGPSKAWSISNIIAQANSDLGHSAVTAVDMNEAPRFYVSADSVETLQLLYKDFSKDDIVHLPRDCDDRGASCIVYAFADIILLSRTGALLASGWSSFSEAAARMRVRPEGMDPSRNDGFVIRTSGVDFGGPSRWRKLRSTLGEAVERFRGRRKRRQIISQEERRRQCEQRHTNATTK